RAQSSRVVRLRRLQCRARGDVLSRLSRSQLVLSTTPLLMTWPLGFLAYMPAYVAWCVGGFTLYLWAASDGFSRRDRLPMLAVAPAVAINVFTGQIGFITATLISSALKWLDRRPIVAGICFGLLTVKPQLGLLVPLMLMLTRRWITFAAATATVAAMAVLAACLFGFDVWAEYFR